MAARGVNRVILLGNLGGSPEVRQIPNGGMVANFTIATSENWNDRVTGQSMERTEWHRIVTFNRLAEISSQYLKKGSKVFVSGSLRTRKWIDHNGVERYTTEIVASEMQMLDGVEVQDRQIQPDNTQEKSSPTNTTILNLDDIPF